MIKDASARAEIQQEWAVIDALVSWKRSAMASGSYMNETPPDAFYNLPLVLAYSTLDSALGQMITEHLFPCVKANCFKLGDKMISAKTAIRWVDFALVDAGRIVRNDLAHKNKIAAKPECLKYISAVGVELKSWGIV